MNAKTLTVLILVTLLIAGLAFVGRQRREEAKAAPGVAAGSLYPGLIDHVNEVEEIEIVGPDGTLDIEHGDGGWGLASKGGYPVGFDHVKQLVMGIAQMKILEAKTSKPERYEKLGVQDAGDPDSRSSRVTLRNATGDVLADLVVGTAKYDLGTEALYVRRADEDQAWLVTGSVTVNSRPKTWLETEILKLDRDRVARVEVTQPDGEVLRVERPDGEATEWTALDVPEGRELTSTAAPGAVGGGLTWVALDDVVKADQIDFDGAVRTEFTTFDGLVVTVRTVEHDGVYWTDYTARYDPERAVAPEPEPEAEPEAEPAEGEETAEAEPAAEEEQEPPRDVAAEAAEAAELNERLSGWAFAVPVYKAESFTKRMEDLLKDVVLPEAEPEAKTEPETEASGAAQPVPVPVPLEDLAPAATPEPAEPPTQAADGTHG